MSAQDAAIAASAAADTITLQANALNTSQLHFAGYAAHNAALAAWTVVGTSTAKASAHAAQAAAHLTTANQLKAAGK